MHYIKGSSLSTDYIGTIEEWSQKNDAVCRDSNGWHFWDETQSDCYGPYDTEDQALEAMAEYCVNVLG